MSRRPNLEQRQAILQAAHRLMYRSGLKGISMDDVALAAGIKKANLFHYYPTKDALALAVFDYATQGPGASGSAMKDPEADPIEAVEGMFDQACGTMSQSGCLGGCFVGNMAQELSDDNETLRRRVAEHLSRWAQQIAGFLAGHHERGYFRDDFQPHAAAQSILSLFEGAMLFCKASKSTESIENAKRMAVSYLRSQTR